MTQAQSRSRRPPRGIRYVAEGDRGGYAEAARRQILGLMRAGVPIFWTPISGGSRLDNRIADQDLAHLCDAPVDHDWVLMHSVPEHFPAWTLDADGRRRAGITVWDTDRPPHAWPPLLNRMEKIGLVRDAELWLAMRNTRNRIVHDYLPEQIAQMFETISGEHGNELLRLHTSLGRNTDAVQNFTSNRT